MGLKQWVEPTGLFLFRYRGQIPVLTLLVFFLVMSPQDGIGFSLRGLLWALVCLAVSLVGLAIRVITVGSAPEGTSGRNRHHQVANALNTTGTYSVVRHPLYVGNFLIFFGISMVPHSFWIVVLNTALFCVFYAPIIYAEERFLARKFGAAHQAWSQVTPVAIPQPWKWRRAAQAFRARHAIRREYQTFFAIIGYYALLEMTGDIVEAGRLVVDPVFAGIFLGALALYFVARYVIKNTRLFVLAQS
jgi:protein-S-isoprenylcysteine O-methyltransferase Ste14